MFDSVGLLGVPSLESLRDAPLTSEELKTACEVAFGTLSPEQKTLSKTTSGRRSNRWTNQPRADCGKK